MGGERVGPYPEELLARAQPLQHEPRVQIELEEAPRAEDARDVGECALKAAGLEHVIERVEMARDHVGAHVEPEARDVLAHPAHPRRLAPGDAEHGLRLVHADDRSPGACHPRHGGVARPAGEVDDHARPDVMRLHRLTERRLELGIEGLNSRIGGHQVVERSEFTIRVAHASSLHAVDLYARAESGRQGRRRHPDDAPGNNYVVEWSIRATRRRAARAAAHSLSASTANLRALRGPMAADPTACRLGTLSALMCSRRTAGSGGEVESTPGCRAVGDDTEVHDVETGRGRAAT